MLAAGKKTDLNQDSQHNIKWWTKEMSCFKRIQEMAKSVKSNQSSNFRKKNHGRFQWKLLAVWNRYYVGLAVAQRVEQVSKAEDRKAVGSNPGSARLSWAACRSVLEQDTEPQIAPEGPVMSWRPVQGVPCLCLETAGIGSSDKPCDPLKKG